MIPAYVKPPLVERGVRFLVFTFDDWEFPPSSRGAGPMTTELSTAATLRIAPYVGPRPLRRGEPLHGRERELRSIVNNLPSGRVVLLHSPSGAGKTPLIQTKIVPAFEQRGFPICASALGGFSAPSA